MQIFGYTRENGGSWFSPEGGSPCRQRRLLNNSYAIECPLTVMFERSATQRLQRKYIIMEADPDKTFKIKNQNSMSSLRHCCRSGGINIRRSGMHASTNK